MKSRSMYLTYSIAWLGGWLFSLLHVPIPWILGPVTTIIFMKFFGKAESKVLPGARDLAFTLLGIQIGLTFSSHTFTYIVPYLVPYTILSLFMIVVSLMIGLYISKMTSIDKTTSLVGSSPGGLSAMIAVSESLNGNSALITIFHTLRLLSVLFILPFFVTHMLSESSSAAVEPHTLAVNDGSIWTILIYLFAFALGWKWQHRIPASLVIVPMLLIGFLQTVGLTFFQLPDFLFVLAQLLIGTFLGHTISLGDIIKAGKTCLYFLTLAIFMIVLGIGLSFLLAAWTGMDIITAVLSLAPGGLVEMAITAEQTGGQPAIVSSLQTIRLLTIILVLPIIFQKYKTYLSG
ncbi:AbrB family transcriptional regulator [Halobacillus sp. H74]|uniref:AbrB family transcriptional regulator n=1 Tax=Halobacillus sp. H74 TaxID=3457436 RepID=UPI003FCE434A